jgi:hypothetical protein
MMGASGFALLIGALVAGVLGFSCSVSLGLVIGGLSAIGVALYRGNKFDEYVAAAAAVLARRGGEPQEPPHEA